MCSLRVSLSAIDSCREIRRALDKTELTHVAGGLDSHILQSRKTIVFQNVVRGNYWYFCARSTSRIHAGVPRRYARIHARA